TSCRRPFPRQTVDHRGRDHGVGHADEARVGWDAESCLTRPNGGEPVRHEAATGLTLRTCRSSGLALVIQDGTEVRGTLRDLSVRELVLDGHVWRFEDDAHASLASSRVGFGRAGPTRVEFRSLRSG